MDLFLVLFNNLKIGFDSNIKIVYYRVFNPVISIANVENAQESTRLLAQTSLRNVLGTISLAEILSNREAVSCCMREILDEATDK
jgi:erythrocyte band 7 integral membrane protein